MLMKKRDRRNKARKPRIGGYHQSSSNSALIRPVSLPVTFVASATFTASATPQYFPLLTNSGPLPRALSLLSDFDYYRITQLKLTLYTTNNSTTGFFLGYEPARSDTTPSGATVVSVSQLACNGYLSPGRDNNVVVKVPSSQLHSSPVRLFGTGTLTGNTDNEQQIQAYLILIPTSSITQTVYIRIDAVVEFKSPTVNVAGLDEDALQKRLEMLRNHSYDDMPKFVPMDTIDTNGSLTKKK